MTFQLNFKSFRNRHKLMPVPVIYSAATDTGSFSLFYTLTLTYPCARICLRSSPGAAFIYFLNTLLK